MNFLEHVFELLLQFFILRSLVEFTDEMPACLKHLRTEAQRSVTKVLLPEGKDISSNPAAGASCRKRSTAKNSPCFQRGL